MLPAITGKQAISDADRKLFALPVNLGGLGIPILSDVASHELSNSALVTEPLVKSILKQSVENATEIEAQQKDARKKIREVNRKRREDEMEVVLTSVTNTTRKATVLVQEQGASAWLGTLPIEEHGFSLHKRAFRDALALRYGWQPNELPPVCSCGKATGQQEVYQSTATTTSGTSQQL